MTKQIRTVAYLSDICIELKAKADLSKQQKIMDDYDLGYSMAMYEMMSLLHQQAEVFGVPLDEIGLNGVDPERDYLVSKSTHQKAWIILETTNGDRIPDLDHFQYDGSKLNVVIQFNQSKKTLTCGNVLAFRMIEEGCAFHTLASQNFDGKAWLLGTDQSTFLNWFNQESESIYSDSLTVYIVVTQHQIFEFITNSEMIID